MSLNSLKAMWQQALPQLPMQSLAPLAGASANRLYLVTADKQRFVLRLHSQANQFAVSRQQEWQMWQQAAEQGIAPKLIYWQPQHRFCVSEYVGEAVAKVQPKPLASLLWQLHQLPLAGEPVDVANMLAGYAQGVDVSELTPWLAQVPSWLHRLQQSQLPLACCHRDLHQGNLRQQQGGYLALDFEYAAISHPLLDLAAAGDDQLAEHYFQLTGSGFNPQERQAFAAAQRLVQLQNALWSLRMLQQADAEGDRSAISQWYQTALNWLRFNEGDLD